MLDITINEAEFLVISLRGKPRPPNVDAKERLNSVALNAFSDPTFKNLWEIEAKPFIKKINESSADEAEQLLDRIEYFHRLMDFVEGTHNFNRIGLIYHYVVLPRPM